MSSFRQSWRGAATDSRVDFRAGEGAGVEASCHQKNSVFAGSLNDTTRLISSNVCSNSAKVKSHGICTIHRRKETWLHGFLWNFLDISVVADDVAERTRLNRKQGIQLQSLLLQSSFGRMGKEEPVSSHQSLELGCEDAGEGRTDEAVIVGGLLSKTATEGINLIDVGIDCRQVCPVQGVDLGR